MKIYLHIPLLALFACSAISSETINEQANMKPNGKLKVSNVAGTVDIEGWSNKRIEVTGKLGDDSTLIFDVDDDTAVVEVEFKNHGRKRHRNLESSDLVIRVPHSTRVSVSTVSADLTVRDIKGVQRLKTVSGDLKTQVFGEDVDAKTVSGEIIIEGNNSASNLMVGTVSGDVEVTDVAGEISARSVSGDIELDATEFSRLDMKSVSGDLDCSGDLEKGGRVDAESVSGDVNLNLENLYDTEYYVESFSGDIDPVLDYKAKRTSKYAPGSRLELTEGKGSSRIQIETMSGDVEISTTGKTNKKPDVQ
ncbi:MAG: DUF4097 family beta strand repeat-containing protein [Gammaproteobacteria bacterium]|nr:DUF4097 family beta strand repeat-containing protein [Gammaproteobacteria bacterium]MDH3767500.1 DUF4097 family beta strand repeat-containing protein [Gammaproteobacteria bacterium]